MLILEKAMTLELPVDEREQIAVALERTRREWQREMLHFELVSGAPGAPRRAFQTALAPGHGVLPRLKMIAAAVAPGVARRVLRLIDRFAGARGGY
jgi:hypothetical protein